MILIIIIFSFSALLFFILFHQLQEKKKYKEFDGLRFQIETLKKNDSPLSTQIATSKRGGTRYLPYAFT